MIVVSKNNLPYFLKVYSTPDWSTGIGDFEGMERVLDEFIENGQKTILVYSDECKDENFQSVPFPPIGSLMLIVGKLLLMRNKLKEAIHMNIIEINDETARSNVENVLNYYTPVNRTELVESKKDIARLINTFYENLSDVESNTLERG
jgi:hypothetical protein